LREEHRLRVFGIRVLRIFGPKREEDRAWRKLHNEELFSLYSLSNIVRMIKSRRMRWVGHTVCMGEGRSVRIVFTRRPKRKRPPGGLRCRWEDNIKLDLREMWISGVNWIRLAEDRVHWRVFVNKVMNLWVL
jgi:hypothetical protein